MRIIETRKCRDLKRDVLASQILLPMFQREPVWSRDEAIKLMDSIARNYSIGMLLIWKTDEKIRYVPELAGVKIKAPAPGAQVNILLDGHQRVATITRALSSNETGFADIFVNLAATGEEPIITGNPTMIPEGACIRLKDLVGEDHTKFEPYRAYQDQIVKYRQRILNFEIPVEIVSHVPLSEAAQMFTRINVGGKPLTLTEIMVAKTYDEDKEFNLADKLRSVKERLQVANYHKIKSSTILQCLGAMLANNCVSGAILDLDKDEVIEKWPAVETALIKAVEYIRNRYFALSLNIIPYQSLIVLYAYFFYHRKKSPVGKMSKRLDDFFWKTSLGGRYASGADSKINQDLKKIDAIIAGEMPEYEWAVDVSPEHLFKIGEGHPNNHLSKPIMCLLASFHPASLRDGTPIPQIALTRNNSREAHHWFPKSHLRDRFEKPFIYHVFNHAILDAFNNKEISGNPPVKYLKEYEEENPDFDWCLKTHLIDVHAKKALLEDRYEDFLLARAVVISAELEKRLIQKPALESKKGA
jgi:hypothetical protein